MFFNKSKSNRKKATRALMIWSEAVCMFCDVSDADSEVRNLIIISLIGSCDYLCQSLKLGDDDFVQVVKVVLESCGFSKNEIWLQLGKFAQQNFTEIEFNHLMKGADFYKKWAVDGNKNAPMLLGFDL